MENVECSALFPPPWVAEAWPVNFVISSEDHGSEGYHIVLMVAFQVGSESGLPSSQLSDGHCPCHVGVASSAPPSFIRHSQVTLLCQTPRRHTQVHSPSSGNLNTCLRTKPSPCPSKHRGCLAVGPAAMDPETS